MESLRNTASLKKFEFLRQLSKALRKLKKSCFALDHLYIELKMKMKPAMFCLSNSNVYNKNSKFDSHLLYCEVDSYLPFQTYRWLYPPKAFRRVKSAVTLKWQVGFENGIKMTPIFTIIFISKMLIWQCITSLEHTFLVDGLNELYGI